MRLSPKKLRKDEDGVAIFEYAMILGTIALVVSLVLPKYASANDNAFQCAAGGLDSPATCVNGVMPSTSSTTSTGTTSTSTSTSTSTTTASLDCHYDNGKGNGGSNEGVVCTPTGNSSK